MTIHVGSQALLVLGGVALLGVAAVVAGLISLSQLALLGLVLICPLMMFAMMQPKHGGSEPEEHPQETPSKERPKGS